MKGLLIDPFTKSVLKIEIPNERVLYHALGCENFERHKVNECAPESIVMLVNDELLDRENQAYFKVNAGDLEDRPFAGRAIVLHMGQDGKLADCQVPREAMVSVTNFLPYADVKDALSETLGGGAVDLDELLKRRYPAGDADQPPA